MDPLKLEPRRSFRFSPILLTGIVVAILAAWAETITVREKSAPRETVIPAVQVTLQRPEPPVSELSSGILEQGPSSELPTLGPEPEPDISETSPIATDGQTAAFLGIQESTRRVVIAFDVAESVRRKAETAGLPLERIRDEAALLVRSLDERSAFVLLQFVRRYEQFPQEMLPASSAIRSQALEWLRDSFKTDGRSGGNWTGGDPDGIELILLKALEMQPEVVFLISDGDFQRTRGDSRRGWENVSWASLEELVGHWQIHNRRRVRIHVIGIQMEPEHQKEARRFVSRFGGQLRLIQ